MQLKKLTFHYTTHNHTLTSNKIDHSGAMAIDTHTTAECGTTHITVDSTTLIDFLHPTMIDKDTMVVTQAMTPILMPSMHLMSPLSGTLTTTPQ